MDNNYEKAINRDAAVKMYGSDWSHQAEVRLRFVNFPATINTKVVWDIFSREGTVVSIDIFESNGKPDGNGIVRFR